MRTSLLPALLVVALSSAGAMAQPAAEWRASVETIAGPGFCAGRAVRDQASSSVRSMAIDGDGVLHVATGPPGDGLLARIDAEGQTQLVRTRLPAGPGATRPSLAPDESGGEGGSAAAGDGGPFAEARFRDIRSMASDKAGNLYVAEGGESVSIRFLNRSQEAVLFYAGTSDEVRVEPGTIQTIFDGPPPPVGAGPDVAIAVAWPRLYLGSSTPGRSDAPARVDVVNLGSSSVVSRGKDVAPRAVSTVAGGASADFSALSGIAADADGTVYLADQSRHRVLRLDPAGLLTRFAGTGAPGFNGNGVPALDARLDRPSGVAVGPHGRVYVADEGNGQVRFVERGLVHAALGNGVGSSWRCEPASPGGPVERPSAGRPSGVAVDRDGSVYFALSDLAQVKKVDRSGSITTVAGRAAAAPPQPCSGKRCPGPEGDGGPATDAKLGDPSALVLTAAGGLYVLDAADGRVRLVNIGARPLRAHGITIKPGLIATVAGRGPGNRDADPPDGAPAATASIEAGPGGIASDSKGNLFVADGRRLRQVDSRGVITTILAGSGIADPLLCCHSIGGLTTDGAGNLYVSDWMLGRVWFLNRGSGPVTAHGQPVAAGDTVLVAGAGSAFRFEGDGGPALDAHLAVPGSMTVDGGGSLWIAPVNAAQDHSVRKVDPGGTISTPVGAGAPGFNGDGLAPARTTFSAPVGVAVDPCGNLVVADHANGRVRRVRLSSCTATGPGDAAGRGGPDGPLLAVVGAAAVLGLAGGAVVLRHRRRPPTPGPLAVPEPGGLVSRR